MLKLIYQTVLCNLAMHDTCMGESHILIDVEEGEEMCRLQAEACAHRSAYARDDAAHLSEMVIP
jgi:hypothetical protein